ncbi:6-phospho-3-hexuloisomerase [Companilactobacillus versmoldensis]|uniref:6-phospho 3-hexuloisomerase n=1 Tax=Companilactobacillus versmoldensis DSM 14857 = KCTC 3814 TaxID=1423815 RepID=A0A0R1SDI5_9LACO|nr:6-phospho-3-hexuloisomerase [Companilactobacillus versmoldensis]KRL66729.1 6-phospho 3-hexuloisomerase [Companilactobacillus versmoldensis DSM 14857 = KCTC 3814]
MNNFQIVAQEIKDAADQFPEDKTFLEKIDQAKSIFTYGLGRSGLATKMFAMRLSQMGYDVNVVGEITNKPIGKDDLLIVASGSGETGQAVLMAKKAKSFGAQIALMTSSDDSTIEQQADLTLKLGGKRKDETATDKTIQPMGALFEQSLLVYLDAVILDLMKADKREEAEMFQNHANLE